MVSKKKLQHQINRLELKLASLEKSVHAVRPIAKNPSVFHEGLSSLFVPKNLWPLEIEED
jgi:hypothetical protein